VFYIKIFARFAMLLVMLASYLLLVVMMKSSYFLSPIGFLVFVLIASCEKACRKKPDFPINTEIKVEKETVEALITSFPALNLAGLTENKVASFTRFLNEEICPCGCPKTFAQCLVTPGCKPATLLANWAIAQLKNDVPEQILYKAISEEINLGYLASPIKLNYLNAYKKGSAQPKVTIVEFADFECPACRNAAHEMKEFLKAHNDVELYFMHYPLSNHLHAELAAISSEAAGLQGKFWEMHDLLFEHQGPLTKEAIISIAQTIFNKKQMAQFEKDLKNPALLQKIKLQKEYAHNDVKIMGTPSFLWNGRPFYLFSSKDAYLLRFKMEEARNEISCR
jgi:protein-disulfide isomerase